MIRLRTLAIAALVAPLQVLANPMTGGIQALLGQHAACFPLRNDWAPQAASLKSLWHLDESTGATTFSDSSGNSNSGNAVGYAASAVGRVGNALYIHGTSGMFTTNQMAAPQIFTLTAWVKTTATTGGAIFGMADTQSGGASNYDRQLMMTRTGQISFGIYDGTTNVLTTTLSYNDGNWHHVAAIYNTGTAQIYVDGTLVASKTMGTAQAMTAYWRIGDAVINGWNYPVDQSSFSGTLDELGIWSVALSPSEISTLSTASSGVDSTNPEWANTIGIYHLAETNGVFTDASGHGNTATAIGGTGSTANGLFGNGYDSGGIVSFTTTNLFSDPEAFTISTWINTVSTTGGVLMELTLEQTGQPSSYDRFLTMENNGDIAFGSNGGGSLTVIRSSAAYNDGKWHHVVLTFAAGAQSIYVDGHVVASGTQATAQGNNGYWRIANGWLSGWSVTATSSQYTGYLDETAYWSTALTGDEVRRVYNQQSCGKN